MREPSPSSHPPRSAVRGAIVAGSAVVVVLIVVLAGVLWVSGSTDDASGGGGQDGGGEQADATGSRRPLLVHLGDSYASGAGTQPLVEDSPLLCQRSQRNFGELVAARGRMRIVDASCAGATTGHLYDAQYDGVDGQLEALDPDAAVVTLMLGGNDSAMFSTIVGECSRAARDDPAGDPCRRALGDEPLGEIDRVTGPNLERALREVRGRAPRARVVIAGYPWLIGEHACRPAVQIADGDVAYVRALQRRLNRVVRAAADAAGAIYVDMSRASVGHDACAPKPRRWIEPQIGADSAIVLHPNESGQQAIADAVAAALGR
ncbi:SGNH/GDSL hydrolase family protein [Gordonia shandongensis]|uniref:SGNH/GDSL hydrolase family protein n=1 Tax=Gordonia shandongensis TaxID=376351 RepID=UPI00040EED75|nr:SGNH/GDSL hydrolase family protein [Gordonia shandongensis]